MRKIISIALCAGLISTVAFARGGHGRASQQNTTQPVNTTVVSQEVSSSTSSNTSTVASSSLSQNHINDLLYMYEEEKMARDVYRTLGDIWNARVFYNIQSAEQRHMDSIRSLLVAYGVPVPSLEDSTGVFENQEIQALYDQLVDIGQNSLTDAYEAGVMVEETDIADLESKIVDAPSDIVQVYNSLLSGSYNHLRSFNRVLGN